MKKKIKKFFVIQTFITTLLLAILVVILKIFIPNQYQFIEPVSIYWTILSSVIFIYWFILWPAISEYKESEKIIIDVKNSILNIKEDSAYFKWLQSGFDLDKFNKIFYYLLNTFFHDIADDEKQNYVKYFEELNEINLKWEILWIPANHIIRMKQELSLLKKNFLRISDIKERETLPVMIHKLKNFITFIVILILLFLKISSTWPDFISQIQESIMLFLFTFLYVYLSFIISSFDNPFDKRKFSWYLDLYFLKDLADSLYTKKEVKINFFIS